MSWTVYIADSRVSFKTVLPNSPHVCLVLLITIFVIYLKPIQYIWYAACVNSSSLFSNSCQLQCWIDIVESGQISRGGLMMTACHCMVSECTQWLVRCCQLDDVPFIQDQLQSFRNIKCPKVMLASSCCSCSKLFVLFINCVYSFHINGAEIYIIQQICTGVRTSQGDWGAARPQTRAKGKFFGQKPAAQNGEKICVFIKWKTVFILSSEIKCPKCEIFTNNYWVGWAGQSNFAS